MTDISALEAYAGQIAEAAVKSGAASEKQHEYIHGDDQSDVFTESGFVPTIAKQARLSAEGTAGLEGKLADPYLGSGMVAWTDPVAPAFLKVTSDMKNGEAVSIMRGIPKAHHDAIYNFTSAYDVAPNLNELFDEGYKFTAPSGNFYLGSEVIMRRDGSLLEGAGIGASRDIARLQSFTRFWSDKDIVFFKADAAVYSTIRDMLLQVTVPHTNPHVLFLGGAKGTLESVRINGINDSTVGSGVVFDGGSMGIVDRCTFDNASVDVKTWDVHITNSWVWANSKPWGIRTVGSIGNLLIQGTDVVPPRADVPGKKAGIYITGPALQPRIIGCYGDGNPILDCGPFILAENGVLGLQVIGGNSNTLDEGGIILDSIIAPKVIGHNFYNGNNKGSRAEAADIILRQTFAQPLEKPLLQSNTHTQVYTRSTPAPAVLVKAGTKRAGMRIIDNTITQIGTGGGYTEDEIRMEDGAFPNKIAGSLRGNIGQRSHYCASASVPFVAGDVSKNIPLGVTLAYLPRVDQVHVNIEGVAVPFRVQVVNTSTILVGMPAGGMGSGTIHVSIELD